MTPERGSYGPTYEFDELELGREVARWLKWENESLRRFLFTEDAGAFQS